MQIRKIHRRGKDLSLDLTPLIDCVFLLLIFFMVGTQLINDKTGLKIELPKSSVVEMSEVQDLVIFVDQSRNMEISYVTTDNNNRVNEKATMENLESILTEKLKLSVEKNVVIKADKGLSHGDVVEIMTISKNAGATSLDIATENEK